MKDITFKSNFGRFATALTCTVGDEVNAATVALATQGLANVQFRAVASEVEKALIAAGAMTKEAKRSAIPFTPANLAIIVAKGQEKLDAVCKKEGLPSMLLEVTGEHVYGESDGAPTKEAIALWTQIQALPEADFTAVLKGLGLDPENYDDDTAIVACKAHIRKVKEEAKASMLAKLPKIGA